MAEGCSRCPHLLCRLDAVRRAERYLDVGEESTLSHTPVLRLYCSHRGTVEYAAGQGAEARREFVTQHISGVDHIVDTYDTILIEEHPGVVSISELPTTVRPEWCRCDAVVRE